jgi:hypothetical protein
MAEAAMKTSGRVSGVLCGSQMCAMAQRVAIIPQSRLPSVRIFGSVKYFIFIFLRSKIAVVLNKSGIIIGKGSKISYFCPIVTEGSCAKITHLDPKTLHL